MADQSAIDSLNAKLRSENDKASNEIMRAGAEIARLRGMIQHALDGPDDAWRSILQDALDGKDGP